MGRALRLHLLKTYANIILPFRLMIERINTFKSFVNKTLGGYINIDHTDVENEEVEFRYEMVYNSIGQWINGQEAWLSKFEQFKIQLDKDRQLPSCIEKDKEKLKTYNWMHNNKYDYKHKNRMMAYENIYNLWHNFITNEPYNIYFASREQKWYKQFDNLKIQIDQHGKLPTQDTKDKKLAKSYRWLNTQRKTFETREHNMANDELYNVFKTFINSKKIQASF